jgi:hypothetical protein
MSVPKDYSRVCAAYSNGAAFGYEVADATTAEARYRAQEAATIAAPTWGRYTADFWRGFNMAKAATPVAAHSE